VLRRTSKEIEENYPAMQNNTSKGYVDLKMPIWNLFSIDFIKNNLVDIRHNFLYITPGILGNAVY